VAVHSAETPQHQALQTLVVAAVLVCLADRISQQELAVQVFASLGIGVKHGTLCKN
jgi:hypothetical protein